MWVLLRYPRVAMQWLDRWYSAFWSADRRRSSLRTILWKCPCRTVGWNWSFPRRYHLERKRSDQTSVFSTDQWMPLWRDDRAPHSTRHSRRQRWKNVIDRCVPSVRRIASRNVHRRVVDVCLSLQGWIMKRKRSDSEDYLSCLPGMSLRRVMSTIIFFRFTIITRTTAFLFSLSSKSILTSVLNWNNSIDLILEFEERADRLLSSSKQSFTSVESLFAMIYLRVLMKITVVE